MHHLCMPDQTYPVNNLLFLYSAQYDTMHSEHPCGIHQAKSASIRYLLFKHHGHAH